MRIRAEQGPALVFFVNGLFGAPGVAQRSRLGAGVRARRRSSRPRERWRVPPASLTRCRAQTSTPGMVWSVAGREPMLDALRERACFAVLCEHFGGKLYRLVSLRRCEAFAYSVVGLAGRSISEQRGFRSRARCHRSAGSLASSPSRSLPHRGALEHLQQSAGTVVVLGVDDELDRETKRVVDARGDPL